MTSSVRERRVIRGRCIRCRDPMELCMCQGVPRLELRTRVELVLHAREAQKCATTGPFALTALSNSRLHLYGTRNAPLDLSELCEEAHRRVLVLFPGENAIWLTAELLQADPRPVTLVVPDGTFRQTGRAVRRIPGLENAQQVKLPGLQSTTFVALSHALGILESPSVEQNLIELFEQSQRRRRRSGPATASRKGTGPQGDSKSDLSTPLTLPILFEDESFVAINKPSGMLVHRGWAKDGTPALQILRDQIGQHLFPVHRLDRATSGALLFAKSPEVACDLGALFDADGIDKRYLALCRGHQFEERRVSHSLAPEKGKARMPAVTDFRLLGSFERYGLIEAIPRTGRTHQVRRHLKHLSHPIVGDVRYGKGEHNRVFRERFGFQRLALHCECLSFQHPRSGVQTRIHAPLPQDFARLLDELGLELAVR